jgi:ribonuclease HII
VVIGIDEVGRGSLAGPLVVGCVSLNKTNYIFKDSKLLSPKKRILEYRRVLEYSKFWNIGYVWPDEIDKFGLTLATKIAINRALQNLDVSRHQILIDGNINFLGLSNVSTIIGGDKLNQNIGAASILAKVSRDRLMEDYHLLFSNYSFLKNKGYGTKEHFRALSCYGVSPIHRLLFLKNLKTVSKS